MTIKQQGGVFGRNPTFNNVDVESDLTVGGTVTHNGTQNITGQLNVDNLRLDGNTISTTDTNGSLVLNPNGTGDVDIPLSNGGTVNINSSIYTDTVLNMASASGSGGTQTRITLGDGTYQNGTLAAYGSVYGGGLNYAVMLASNAVNSSPVGGTFTYSASAEASRLLQQGGRHYLQYVASGTAGDTISWQTAFSTTTSGNIAFPSGQGIDFSATAGTGTSELFDDYEEGTWTPTVQGAGTAGTYTLSGTTAKYTKVGNQVTVWAQFGFSAASGGTNYIVIGGLPFTYAAGAGVFGSIRADSFNFTTATPASLVVAATTGSSGTTLGILELRDNAGPVDAPISGVSTSTLIGFTITYQV